jgi:DNA helicase-2/ATP-dependent DNA helicase PcrA
MLRLSVLKIIERLKASKKGEPWSIAVLVKSKLETLAVSSYFTTHNIFHEVLIDPAGPSLSATIIASMLEPGRGNAKDEETAILKHLINHIKGRKGSKLSIKDNDIVKALEKYISTGKIAGSTRLKLIAEVNQIVSQKEKFKFSGIPEDDWLTVRKLFQESMHDSLTNVYHDARFLRLLNKGAVLSETLAELWRLNGNYHQAGLAVDAALTQEHFSMANRLWRGIVVMNMHKSKGKEFDEVLIWEELFKQIVPFDASESRLQSERLLLRVAVTRAKSKTTILTPQSSPGLLF